MYNITSGESFLRFVKMLEDKAKKNITRAAHVQLVRKNIERGHKEDALRVSSEVSQESGKVTSSKYPHIPTDFQVLTARTGALLNNPVIKIRNTAELELAGNLINKMFGKK